MKTSELIELADYCADTYCEVCKHYMVNCWGDLYLIEKLRSRLEKAYADIQQDCYTCRYSYMNSGVRHEECDGCNVVPHSNYLWVGDEE